LTDVDFDVVIHRLAQQDVDGIFSWLSQRSRSGAIRWYAAFLQAVGQSNRQAGA
jgi:hypothetical protein